MSANPETLLFRRAGKNDAAAVQQLTRDVYAKWVPIIGREPMPMQADFDKVVAEHWVDLVEHDGQLIALIEMIPMSDHLYVESIAVSEVYQGKGLARHLLEHAADLARASQLPEIRLLTNKAFASNVSLYGRLGFENYQEIPFPGGGTTVYFRRPVS